MRVHSTLLASLPSPAASSVDERSTAFQPVEGGTEHRSGESLLVGAYAGLWLVLMTWLLLQWRKQGALKQRVDELEATLNAAAGVAAGVGAKPSTGATPANR